MAVDTAPATSDTRTRLASRRYLAAYLTTGVLLTMIGRMLWVWVGYGLAYEENSVSDLLRALVDPSVRLDTMMLGRNQWAVGGALMVVGLLALMRRTAARGAAMVLAAIIAWAAVRELIGIASDPEFRSSYFGDTALAAPIIGSWLFALAAAVSVLIMMGRSGTADHRMLPGSEERPYLISGVLMLFLGLATLGWLLRRYIDPVSAGSAFADNHLLDYAEGLVNAGGPMLTEFAGSEAFYETAYAVGFLVLGTLALLRRPVARGGALVLSSIMLYLNLRQLAGITFTGQETPATSPLPTDRVFIPSWGSYAGSWEGRLWLATLVLGTIAAATVLVMLLRAPGRVLVR
ncbi:hypothetical protein [Streptomyces boninensis]|uniref:hypothetical protein n=1 Tax=Streptomyces boninensis TaxID=2039455 RepID=UPI003B2189E2